MDDTTFVQSSHYGPKAYVDDQDYGTPSNFGPAGMDWEFVPVKEDDNGIHQYSGWTPHASGPIWNGFLERIARTDGKPRLLNVDALIDSLQTDLPPDISLPADLSQCCRPISDALVGRIVVRRNPGLCKTVRTKDGDTQMLSVSMDSQIPGYVWTVQTVSDNLVTVQWRAASTCTDCGWLVLDGGWLVREGQVCEITNLEVPTKDEVIEYILSEWTKEYNLTSSGADSSRADGGLSDDDIGRD